LGGSIGRRSRNQYSLVFSAAHSDEISCLQAVLSMMPSEVQGVILIFILSLLFSLDQQALHHLDFISDSATLERVKGIEPSSQAWEAHVLPLNHTRVWSA
jgi:hypothetical protein